LGQSALLGDVKLGSQRASTKVRLYLDGLDEVSSTNRRQQIIRLAKKSTEPKSRYQVVLTSRDHIYAPYLDWLPRISLGGFEDDDVKALIAQWLGKKTEDSRKFYEQLREIPTLNSLMRTPLLATLIILVFRQTGRLPENKTRLYEVFIELLSGGWDIAKRVLRQSNFGQRVKIPVLKSLAAILHEKRRREFSNDEIKAAIRSSLSKGMLNDWELMRDEFIEDGLTSRGGNIFQFSHLSFQEFLVAKDYIGHPNPTRIDSAVNALLSGDDWWKEPVSFYIGLSGNPREIISWLSSHIRNFRGGNVSHTVISDLLKSVQETFPEYPRENITFA
jgi:predicted NACHT family NTPase